MEWLLVVGIAVGNNLDNLGAGIAYGIGGIRLPPLVNAWISLITFLITAAAVGLGAQATLILPLPLAKLVSACVLCGMGGWLLLPARYKQRLQAQAVEREPSVGVLGLLADPSRADRDGSRHIDLREATLLGVALSINNVGGGVSAGLAHLSVGGTALCSAVLSFLVLWLGSWAGLRLATTRLGDYAQVTAGILLILIGVHQLH